MISYQEFLIREAHIDVPANEKFIDKRKQGAAAIASKAASKGSYAQPTAWHFKAKLPAYDEAHKAVERGESMDFYDRKFRQLLRQLHPRNMNQKQFQEVIGRAEVWGEILIQLRSGKLY